MKKVLTNYILFIIAFAVFVALFVAAMPDRFYTSYQRAAVRQYDYYKSIAKENKIIAIGNSSIVYGLDTDLMTELTGRKTVVLGNQVSFGYPFFMEMSKEYMKPNDIVIIEIMDVDYWDVGIDMNLTGIGKRVDLYRFFPTKMWSDVAKRVPKVILKNIEYIINITPLPDGPYSINAFNENGNYVMERKECVLSDPYQGEGGWTDYSDTDLDPEMVKAFNEYVDYCTERDVKVYFTVRPLCRDVIIPETLTEENMEKRDAAYAAALHAPLISKTADYVYGRDLIWDGHVNSAGQKVRTEQLATDLAAADDSFSK